MSSVSIFFSLVNYSIRTYYPKEKTRKQGHIFMICEYKREIEYLLPAVLGRHVRENFACFAPKRKGKSDVGVEFVQHVVPFSRFFYHLH